jgi:hypothetical protein
MQQCKVLSIDLDSQTDSCRICPTRAKLPRAAQPLTATRGTHPWTLAEVRFPRSLCLHLIRVHYPEDQIPPPSIFSISLYYTDPHLLFSCLLPLNNARLGLGIVLYAERLRSRSTPTNLRMSGLLLSSTAIRLIGRK